MDMTPAILIFTPIFLPVVQQLGVHPVHFGIIMIMNLCIGLYTPPVGSCLFVGCGIAEMTITNVIRHLLPFFAAMVLVLLLVTYLPVLSLIVPKFLASEPMIKPMKELVVDHLRVQVFRDRKQMGTAVAQAVSDRLKRKPFS